MDRKLPPSSSRSRGAATDGRERRSRKTRSRIRRAAGELFVERGIDATTVEDIAAAAGIAKATFYLHFSRKEDLILEYAELRLRHAAEQLPGLLGAIKGAAEYEKLVLDKYYRAQGEEPPARFLEGIRRMGPQLVAHVLMIALIIAGNTIYFVGRRRETHS